MKLGLFKRGIFLRTFILLMTVSVITIVLFGFLIVPEEKKSLLNCMASQAKGFSASFSEGRSDALVKGDLGSVADWNSQAIKAHPEILYIIVVRPDGMSLINTPDLSEKRSSPDPQWSVSGNSASGQLVYSRLVGRKVYHYSYPLQLSGLNRGMLYIGLSASEFENQLSSMYRNILLLSMICFIFTIALSYVFTNQLTYPILSLRETTDRIMRGDLASRADITTGDEVEDLAHSLNKMADRIMHAQDALERRVEERTFELRDAYEKLLREIDDRKHAEEALKESEEKFRGLTESTSDWIWAINEYGIYTYSSPKITDLLGYKPEEVIGKRPFDFMPSEEALRISHLFQSVIDSREPVRSLLNANLHKDGHVVMIETSAVPVFDKNQSLKGYRGINRDVTERKKLEEELLKSQKLESIGILAGGIAHDFNNILTAILTYISLANMDAPDGSKLSKRLGEAEKATLRARDLTQQLITFSRGGQPVMTTVFLNQLIRDSAGFVLRGSKVKAEFSIPEDLWAVEADEGQMSQVARNIVINAGQAMPDGGTVEISVRNFTVEEPSGLPLEKGNYVKISVRDHGHGIREEILPKIFDPYFTTKQTGSGLGLAVSYSIVKNHGGHIEVESEEGAGTTFNIYLPASEKQSLMKMHKSETIEYRSGRILVMDDQEIVLDVAGEILRDLGYEIELCRDGAEALRLFTRAKESGCPFDAVIMDLTIPGGMGGKETIRKLLEIDPDIKAIVSSGYSNDPIMARFMEYGFKEVMAKPYTIADVSKKLRKVLGNS